MTRKALLIPTVIVVVTFATPSLWAAEASVPYLHIITFGLDSPEDESEILSVIATLNDELSLLGYGNIKYRLWKAEDADETTLQYMVGAEWPYKSMFVGATSRWPELTLHHNLEAMAAPVLLGESSSSFLEIIAKPDAPNEEPSGGASH